MRIVNPELRVRCHFFILFFLRPPKPDILTAAPQNKENLARFPEGIRKYCSLNTDVDIFDSGRTFAKSAKFPNLPFRLKFKKKKYIYILEAFLVDGLK